MNASPSPRPSDRLYSYMNPRKILHCPSLSFPFYRPPTLSVSIYPPCFSLAPSLSFYFAMYSLALCSTAKQKAKYQADPERSLKTFVSRPRVYTNTHTHTHTYTYYIYIYKYYTYICVSAPLRTSAWSISYNQPCELSVCCVAGNPRQLTFGRKRGSCAEKNGKSIRFRRVCVGWNGFFLQEKKPIWKQSLP